ncbi:ubinuclein-1-like isoform X2 [Lotus japonicus]|uniref:ubinuclein-1-like isoform X2 n=1 Tax=Lotus japonicus TaxID=34305 RepID=UPI0025848C86|nr:ubinuclein-1-like isoform X2 [Lotus japonicus]
MTEDNAPMLEDNAPPPPPPTLAAADGGGDWSSSFRGLSSFVKKGDRQLFGVELRPDETTIVSWKKLVKDSHNVNQGSDQRSNALESRIAPGQPTETKEEDAPQTHRFSAVIEKIERLYTGKDSSDEEDLLPDDDQYDTEDSFIDDAELDEYFAVDNSAIKHDGFFVNRGALERIARNEPPPLPTQQVKKRRRKDMSKDLGENIDGHVSNKCVKVGKTAARKAGPLPVKKSLNCSQDLAVPGEHGEDLKFQNQLDVSGISSKTKMADTRPKSDPSVAEAKVVDKKIGVHQSKNTSAKSQRARTPSVDNSENTAESQLARTPCSKDKNGIRELPDLNLSEGKSAMLTPKSENILKKDGSAVRPKVTMLEKAIRELEKMVAESRPPTTENQEVDATSQAIKRRLPREIKLKLAKVARLAASQGKVSKELINRLMSILGHLMQLRTLKRNLKIMISTGMSAKQEKDEGFQRIKKEVVEMIKIQAPTMESKQQHQAGASGDQELGPDGKAITTNFFSMDTALEDKICDLYDLFVDGLDENSGPQIRKLYAELAELWPNGYMDNHGIKRAICRAKERRRTLNSKPTDQEKTKRKKLLAPRREENVCASSVSSQQNVLERLAPESGSHSASPNKAVSNTVTAARVLNPSVNGPKQVKAKGNSSGSLDVVRGADGVLIKKKVVKKKQEHKLEGTHFRPEKLASLQGEERQRSPKQSAGLPSKSNLQPTSLPVPGLEQSS